MSAQSRPTTKTCRKPETLMRTTAPRRQLQRFARCCPYVPKSRLHFLCVSFVNIPVSLGNLFQRMGSIYDGTSLSRLDEFFAESQILRTCG
jgi:hypothetical protein